MVGQIEIERAREAAAAKDGAAFSLTDFHDRLLALGLAAAALAAPRARLKRAAGGLEPTR